MRGLLARPVCTQTQGLNGQRGTEPGRASYGRLKRKKRASLGGRHPVLDIKIQGQDFISLKDLVGRAEPQAWRKGRGDANRIL